MFIFLFTPNGSTASVQGCWCRQGCSPCIWKAYVASTYRLPPPSTFFKPECGCVGACFHHFLFVSHSRVTAYTHIIKTLGCWNGWWESVFVRHGLQHIVWHLIRIVIFITVFLYIPRTTPLALAVEHFRVNIMCWHFHTTQMREEQENKSSPNKCPEMSKHGIILSL